MKKLLALLLVFAMATSFVACGKTETVEEQDTIVNEESQLSEEISQEEEEQSETVEEAPAKTEKEEVKKEETKKEETKKPANSTSDKTSDKQQAQTTPSKPAETPAVKPAEKPATTPSKPAEKPVEKPAEKPAETPAEKPEEKPAESGTVASMLVSEFNAKAKSGTPVSIAEAIANGGSLPFMAGAMEVEPGLLAGFDNYEVKGFKSGAVFQPMIGSIAFIGYVFEVDDGTSASDFAQNLKKNANKRWNICVEADEMATSVVGNKVFFVMCPKSFEE